MATELEPIVIELDNPNGQITKLPGNFNGMQGDSNVPLDLFLTKSYKPFDINNLVVGWQQMNADAVALDVRGTTQNIPGKGRVRFILPAQVFAVAGTVEGNFYVLDQANNIKIYSAKMSFTVEPNDVLMNVNTGPFMTDWEAFMDKLNALYDGIEKQYLNADSDVMKLVTAVKSEVEAYQTVIDKGGAVTIEQFNALKSTLTAINQQAATTTALPSAYTDQTTMQPIWEYWTGKALGLPGTLYLAMTVAPNSTIAGAGVYQELINVTPGQEPDKWYRISKSTTEWGAPYQNTIF